MSKKNKGNKEATLAAPVSAPAVAEDEDDGDEEGSSSTSPRTPGKSAPSGGSSGVPSGPAGPRGPLVAGAGGFFHIYKKGQGYWTRMGTAGGAVLIGALTLKFIYDERQTFHMSDTVAEIVCLIFMVAYGLGAYFFMNRPVSVDFLIATDSEMKKVNWTTQKELTGSTKIVIIFVVLMALILFLYDLFFQFLFYELHVLNTGPFYMHR